jgi:uncharacterized protein YjbJ (UPF0337 family)
MNRNQLLTHWDRLRDEAGSVWGRLTDDDLNRIDGNAEELIERLRRRYGYDRIIAEDQVERFLRRYSSATLAVS